MTMADRIAVLESGLLMQLDTPANLYDFPDNLFVAGFIGSPAMNFFSGHLRKDDGKVVVDTGAFHVPVPADKFDTFAAHDGKPVVFGMRPEDIHNPDFTPPGITPAPVEGTVEVTELMGNEIFLHMRAGDDLFVARVDPRSRYSMDDKASLTFNMANMHIFDQATEQAIR
jgi:multiple sugar transport system ATP-binding protein